MPDNTRKPVASPAPAQGVPPAPPGSRSTRAGPQATTTPSAGGSAPAPRPAEGKRHLNPLWLVGGAVVLFALVFGVGAVAQGEESSSAPSGTTIEATTISTIQTVDPSVVQIQAKGQGPAGSVGSGEILSTSGYIVTNSHVVHGFSTYTVLLSSGQTVPAQLVGDVPSQDLAVLKINPGDLNLKPIAVADSSKVQVGEFAVAMGSPLGLEQSATSGIVSALNREGTELVDGKRYTLMGMIQTSAPINPGNSGGALVNLKGQLIGIPTLSAVDSSTGVAANGIGYAISSNTMQAVVHQLTNGAVG